MTLPRLILPDTEKETVEAGVLGVGLWRRLVAQLKLLGGGSRKQVIEHDGYEVMVEAAHRHGQDSGRVRVEGYDFSGGFIGYVPSAFWGDIGYLETTAPVGHNGVGVYKCKEPVKDSVSETYWFQYIDYVPYQACEGDGPWTWYRNTGILGHDQYRNGVRVGGDVHNAHSQQIGNCGGPYSYDNEYWASYGPNDRVVGWWGANGYTPANYDWLTSAQNAANAKYAQDLKDFEAKKKEYNGYVIEDRRSRYTFVYDEVRKGPLSKYFRQEVLTAFGGIKYSWDEFKHDVQSAPLGEGGVSRTTRISYMDKNGTPGFLDLAGTFSKKVDPETGNETYTLSTFPIVQPNDNYKSVLPDVLREAIARTAPYVSFDNGWGGSFSGVITTHDVAGYTFFEGDLSCDESEEISILESGRKSNKTKQTSHPNKCLNPKGGARIIKVVPLEYEWYDPYLCEWIWVPICVREQFSTVNGSDIPPANSNKPPDGPNPRRIRAKEVLAFKYDIVEKKWLKDTPPSVEGFDLPIKDPKYAFGKDAAFSWIKLTKTYVSEPRPSTFASKDPMPTEVKEIKDLQRLIFKMLGYEMVMVDE